MSVFLFGWHMKMQATAFAQPQAQPVGQSAPISEFHRSPKPLAVTLTIEERRILAIGEISSSQQVAGGLMAWMLGFGSGHALQGRYQDVGWKFTLGESLAIAGIVVGISVTLDHSSRYPSESGEQLLIGSVLGYGILRVWEIIDASFGPTAHNKKYRVIRSRTTGYPSYGLYLGPSASGRSGGIAGLQGSF